MRGRRRGLWIASEGGWDDAILKMIVCACVTIRIQSYEIDTRLQRYEMPDSQDTSCVANTLVQLALMYNVWETACTWRTINGKLYGWSNGFDADGDSLRFEPSTPTTRGGACGATSSEEGIDRSEDDTQSLQWVVDAAGDTGFLYRLGLTHETNQQKDPLRDPKGDYTMLVSDDTVFVEEKGELCISKPIKRGDRLCIAVKGDKVSYLLNGEPMYESKTTPTFPLNVEGYFMRKSCAKNVCLTVSSTVPMKWATFNGLLQTGEALAYNTSMLRVVESVCALMGYTPPIQGAVSVNNVIASEILPQGKGIRCNVAECGVDYAFGLARSHNEGSVPLLTTLQKTSSDWNNSLERLDYAWLLAKDGHATCCVDGTTQGKRVAYHKGDTFAVVVVTDAKVAFCHNGKVVHEAALTTPFLLQGVTLFRGPGARAEGVRFLTGRKREFVREASDEPPRKKTKLMKSKY